MEMPDALVGDEEDEPLSDPERAEIPNSVLPQVNLWADSEPDSGHMMQERGRPVFCDVGPAADLDEIEGFDEERWIAALTEAAELGMG